MDRLIQNLVDIDSTIGLWNDLLERAQPFYSGRLVFNFLETDQWHVDGRSQREVIPIPGKMVKFASGRWRFVKLDKVDKYEKLSDLRVGRSKDSDALVRKLIDGIEKLLKDRKMITDQLRAMRVLATGFSASVSTRADNMAKMSLKLSRKVKIDWKEDTNAAIAADSAKNREQYEKRKERLRNARLASKGGSTI